MTQVLTIHPDNPEPRKVRQVVEVIREGGLVVYPTDSCYALGCHMGDRKALKEIQRIRQTDRHHNFTLVCADLSEIAIYAKVDNWAYRLVKSHTPGPYTFILPATRDVPKRLQNPRRKTIGIRIPEHTVPLAILSALGEPIMSSTLSLPGDDAPLTDPNEMLDRLGNDVDLIIDSGNCGFEPTTVVDMTGDFPVLVRAGRGRSSDFE
jgi:tRNA threonylcarbamoyl adenosine modification protein (Sua5/YciO/YrdC/YwlC family)